MYNACLAPPVRVCTKPRGNFFGKSEMVDLGRIELPSPRCPEIVCEPREHLQFRDPVIFAIICGAGGIWTRDPYIANVVLYH